MDSNQFQKETAKFAIYPRATGLEYLVLGLVSEVGEVAGKLKKFLRGDYTAPPSTPFSDYERFQADINAEVGDCLWYISQYCNEMGTTIEQLMIDNIKKLTDRAERNKIRGSGDTR